SLTRRGEVAREDSTEGKPGDGESLAQPRARDGGAVRQRDQMIRAQLCDRSVQTIGVSMPRIARDEDVPSALVELAAERIELLGAVGEAVEEDERTLHTLAVRVRARVAERVDVGAVQVVQGRRNPHPFRVEVVSHPM